MNDQLKVSVVIPVLDDLDALAGLLQNLAAIMPNEIIVVDGASDPDCAALCAGTHCIYLRTRPGRGHQLDTGACRATGDVIWFLHADACPTKSAASLIRRAVADGAVGGYFKFQFTGQSTWYKTLLAWLINLRTRIGVPYGDQGLFIRRVDYAEIAGFAETPLFEEIPLIRAARHRGPFVEVAASIGVSPRRWERDGWIRRTVENRLLAAGYLFGISPDTLARFYRPAPDKGKV